MLKDFDDVKDKEFYVMQQGRLIKELFKKVIRYY
jgi:hypothetical protein